MLQITAGSEKKSIYFFSLIPPRYQTADQVSRQTNFWGRQTYSTYIHPGMHTKSQYLQLKMPGGGCSVTSRQFSSSLLSPQSFCWLQINEPRYKHLPLAQVNLHSERQKRKQQKLVRKLVLTFFTARMTDKKGSIFQVDAIMANGSLALHPPNK